MKSLLILLVLICPYNLTVAQDSDTLPGSWLISARMHGGFIIAHRPSIVQLQKKHVRSFEFEIAKPLNGEEDWQRNYSLPLYSITYQLFDFGNQSELGYGHAVFPRIIFPLNRNKWLRSSLSAGVGLGYINKHFDRYENFKNTAIGSHINAVVSFSYQARIKTSNSTQVEAGIAFSHFSNGSIQPPNLGLNIPTLHTGFSWFIGQPMERTFQPVSKAKKHAFNKLTVGTGVKGIETDHGTEFFGIGTLNYSRVKIISPKSRLSIGSSGFYDKTLVKKLEKRGYTDVSESTPYRLGINVGFELSAGKITLVFRDGFYIIDQYKKDGRYYFNIGVEYKFTQRFFAGYYLKTHFGKADFFEYSLGYEFL